MKKILVSICLVAASTASFSQTATYEAVRLTDQLIEGSWKTIETILPPMLAGLKVQLESSGASKEASKTLTEELQRNFTKGNFAKGYANQISEKFSVDEIVKLSEFYSSPLGQKFFRFSTSDDVAQQSVQLVFKLSCESSKQRLGLFDRGTVNSVCRKY